MGQTTLIQRVDVSRGATPYCTTAVLLENGWEFWGFGWPRNATRDLEVGRLFPVTNKLLLGGYGVVWTGTDKVFVLPMAVYADRLLGGSLGLNLAAYAPLNGGPHILFSDGSSLIWRNARGNGIGLSGSFWSQDGAKPMLRVGPQAELVHGKTTVKLSYQLFSIMGSGAPVARLDLTQRF